jgi:hypothetical protein
MNLIHIDILFSSFSIFLQSRNKKEEKVSIIKENFLNFQNKNQEKFGLLLLLFLVD